MSKFNSLSRNIFLDGVISRPSKGECEVIVYSSEHSHTISEMPIERVELLVKVWIDRYIELYKNQNIKYVLPFENRGEECESPFIIHTGKYMGIRLFHLLFKQN